jgi:hypothetical protein
VFKTKKWAFVSVLSGLVLVLAVGGVWLFGGTSVVRADEMTAENLRSITQSTTGPGLLGEGYLAHGGWGQGERWGVDYQQLLADALGIKLEELQAAYETARTHAIEQAVEQGLITQEQADEMLVWGGIGKRGFGFFGFHRGPKGVSGEGIDEEALLAQALDISVEKLQQARETANQAAIAQAVEEGIITQEQADQMQAHRDLQSYLSRYLSRDALLAAALGISVEDLQAAYADGQTLSDLMTKYNLDAAALREKLVAACDAALDQAVQEGLITQEQADQMKEAPGYMFGGPGGRGWGDFGPKGFDGPKGFRGRGGFDGGHPCLPDSDDTGDTSGMRFGRPGRFLQGDSTL